MAKFLSGRRCAGCPITITWLNVSAQGVVTEEESVPTRLKTQRASALPYNNSHGVSIKYEHYTIDMPGIKSLPELASCIPRRVDAHHRPEPAHSLQSTPQYPQDI